MARQLKLWLDASLLTAHTVAQISPDELVMVLKLTDQHTRAVWTELVCKSFRCARHTRRAPPGGHALSARVSRGAQGAAR